MRDKRFRNGRTGPAFSCIDRCSWSNQQSQYTFHVHDTGDFVVTLKRSELAVANMDLADDTHDLCALDA